MENETKSVETENKEIENKIPPVNTEAETQEQINWKKFREAREIERKQMMEAKKRAEEKEAEVLALKAALEAVVSKPSKPTTQDVYYNDQEESEEEKIRKLVSQQMENERKKDRLEKEKREAEEFPQRLQANLPDFNQICTSDNLDYLEYHYPEVAAAYKNSPDNYDKWANIYKAVKRFVPNTDSKKEQGKADKNFNKPQAMSIPGKTQVGDTAPHSLDDRRKMDNWARMQRTMRGA